MAGSLDFARDDGLLGDLCASFQRAVMDVLTRKTIGAGQETNRSLVTVSGGVSCNLELRAQMAAACERVGLRVIFARPELCTDNAGMIAFVAASHLEAGLISEVAEEIDPNLTLA